MDVKKNKDLRLNFLINFKILLMKYKIKEIDFDKLTFKEVKLNNGKIVNIIYNNDSLEFQTPKVIIDSVNFENNYIILKILPTEACRLFCSKIFVLEEKIKTKYPINTIFKKDTFTIKIPFNYSKPTIKIVSKETDFFNYYHLKEGMEIICLLTCNKLWIGENEDCNYNLKAKEILVTNLNI